MKVMEAMKELITGQKTMFQLPLDISSINCLHNMSYFTRYIGKCSRLHSFPVDASEFPEMNPNKTTHFYLFIFL